MPDDTDNKPEMMPKAEFLKRLASKTSTIEGLKEQLKASQSATAAADAALAAADPAKLERRLHKASEARDAAIAELSAFKATTLTEKALLTEGITDPEDMDLARYRYGKLPEQGRPELSDWLANDAKADRHLQHLWGDDTPAAKQKPDSNGKVKSPIKPPNSLTLEAIMAMTNSERLDPANREAINAIIAQQ